MFLLDNYFDNFYKWFSFDRYARLLHWSEDPLQHNWEKYRKCKNHRQLKEHLYKEIIDLFDSGKMWEIALEICEELIHQYKFETFDYAEMAKLYNRMSSFYDNIMNTDEPRRQPEYFR